MLNNKFSFFSATCFFKYCKCFFVFVPVTFLLYSCTEKPKTIHGFTKSSNHLYYKFCTIGDGTSHAKNDDWLLLNVKCKTQKDSLFFSSRHHKWQGYFLNFNSNLRDSELKDLFSKLNEGDSLHIMASPEIVFKTFFNAEVPSFLKKDSVVHIALKLIALMDSTEMLTYKQSKKQEQIRNSKHEIDELLCYAKEKFTNYETLPEGILLKKIKSNSDSSVKIGQQVSINYKGYFMDGFLVDHSTAEKSFDFTYGTEGQLISGLQIALKYLRKGEVAKFILPSRLAFGEEGSSDGFIPPYTPLVYEMELVNIKQ